MSWADDPELVATFRAEVEERLASLRDGLLSLEGNAAPRQLVASLFRDAHTVKGSARMLGLDAVVTLAHRAEDLLGMLRDGRVAVRPDLVDLLLVTSEALGRSLPGADRPVPESALADVVAALDSALAGADPVTVPRLPARLEPIADDTAEPDDDDTPTTTSPPDISRPSRCRATGTTSASRPDGCTGCSTWSARPSSTYAASSGRPRTPSPCSPSTTRSCAACGTRCSSRARAPRWPTA